MEEEKEVSGEVRASSRGDGEKEARVDTEGEKEINNRGGVEVNKDGMGVRKEEKGTVRRGEEKGGSTGLMKEDCSQQSKAAGRPKVGRVKDGCSTWSAHLQDSS